MLHQFWSFYASVVLSSIFRVNSYRGNYPAFKNWECAGCVDDPIVIFRQVLRALQIDSRETYLLFDHSWMDKLMEPATKVVVKVIPRDELATTQLEQYDVRDLVTAAKSLPEGFSSFVPTDDKYYVVYSPPTESQLSSGQSVLSVTEARQIDAFLTKNPCYMPIQDPPVNFDASSKYPLGPRSRNWRLSAEMGEDFMTQFEYSAIFVRLPAYPYRATCRLYKTITAYQFPKKCPSAEDTERLQVHWLGNIGWVNNLYPLISHLQSAMHNMKVMITPRAQYNGREEEPSKRLYVQIQGGRKSQTQSDTGASNSASLSEVDSVIVKVNGTWGAWADRNECHLEVFAFDPWACHFLSLSSCNTHKLQRVEPTEGYPDDPKEGSAFLSELALIEKDRIKVGDGLHLKKIWEFSRLISFVHRPNIFTRANIKTALGTLSMAVDRDRGERGERGDRGDRDSSSSRDGKGRDRERDRDRDISSSSSSLRSSKTRNRDSTSSSSSSSSSSSGSSNEHRKLARKKSGKMTSHAGVVYRKKAEMDSCIGMHVRHGDSINDRRGEEPLDRSIEAHVQCLRRLSADLGTTSVYLATDNNTLFSMAPRKYSSMNWYVQQRALKDYSGKNFDHRSEKSANREVANLLADMVLMSRCKGLIATYDGGLAHLYLAVACGRGKSGQCPPNLDLWKCQPEAKANSTLYNFLEDPWLNVT